MYHKWFGVLRGKKRGRVGQRSERKHFNHTHERCCKSAKFRVQSSIRRSVWAGSVSTHTHTERERWALTPWSPLTADSVFCAIFIQRTVWGWLLENIRIHINFVKEGLKLENIESTLRILSANRSLYNTLWQHLHLQFIILPSGWHLCRLWHKQPGLYIQAM